MKLRRNFPRHKAGTTVWIAGDDAIIPVKVREYRGLRISDGLRDAGLRLGDVVCVVEVPIELNPSSVGDNPKPVVVALPMQAIRPEPESLQAIYPELSVFRIPDAAKNWKYGQNLFVVLDERLIHTAKFRHFFLWNAKEYPEVPVQHGTLICSLEMHAGDDKKIIDVIYPNVFPTLMAAVNAGGIYQSPLAEKECNRPQVVRQMPTLGAHATRH